MSKETAANEAIRQVLLEQLRITAETYGWDEMIGSEFILWEQLTVEDTRLPPETIKQIAEKIKAADGWWVWPNGYHSESRFVSIAEWDTIRSNHKLPCSTNHHKSIAVCINPRVMSCKTD